jgi:riboflavin kinase/FMN adenylyltransferase
MPHRVLRDLSHLSGHGDSVVAAGSFDGVHIGHRKILSEVAMLARGLSVAGVGVTFDPHPMAVLHPEEAPCLLTSVEERVELMAAAGASEVVVMRFTRRLASRRAEWFVKKVLLGRLRMKRLVIGYDFRFGAGREGDASYLEHLGENLGFGVDIVPPVDYLGHPVSSTRIRTALVRGDVESAAGMLGRAYGFKGKVVKGDGRGRKLGFPTANLELMEPRKMLPDDGVYAVRAEFGRRVAHGALYIGPVPTFGKTARSVEVHLISFTGSLYGKEMAVSVTARIRQGAAFDSPDALRDAIEKDICAVKRLSST